MFALVLVAMLHPIICTIIFAIGMVTWPPVARLVRREFLWLEGPRLRAGLSRHGHVGPAHRRDAVLPNCAAPIIVTASIKVATAILTESGLSFLGSATPT